VRSKINLQSEQKVLVYICEKKDARWGTMNVQNFPLQDMKVNPTGVFYVRGFPTYNTMKHSYYKAAQVLLAHPIAYRLMILETRVLGTYFETRTKNKTGSAGKNKTQNLFCICSFHFISKS
jgi:hypothetical protein